MIGGASKGTSTTTAEIPAELRPLVSQTAGRAGSFQSATPLLPFNQGQTSLQPYGTAPISAQQQVARQQVGQVGNQPGGENLANYFATQAPQIAGQVPGQFNYAAQAPGESNLARGYALSIPGAASQVPGQFRQVSQQAQGLLPYAQQVPSQYGQSAAQAQGLIPQAGQVPGQFAQLQPYAQQVPGQFGAIPGQVQQGYADIGQNIAQDPTIRAGQQVFESTILPTIQHQAGLAGLGRSTSLARNVGTAQAQFFLPLLQESLARQERGVQLGADVGLQEALASERGIGRGYQAGLESAGAQERGIGRQQQAGQFAVGTGLEAAGAQERGIGRGVQAYQTGLDVGLQEALAQERGIGRGAEGLATAGGQLQNLAQAETARRLIPAEAQQAAIERQTNATLSATQPLLQGAQAETNRTIQEINLREQLGQIDQATAQAARDQATADFQRRQALAETALYQPLGQIVPSTIGQSVSQRQGSGLFK